MVWYFGKTAPLGMLCPFVLHLVCTLGWPPQCKGAWKSTSLLLLGVLMMMMRKLNECLAEHLSVTALSSTLGVVVGAAGNRCHPGATNLCCQRFHSCLHQLTHRASLQIQFCNDCSAVEVAVPQEFVIFLMLLCHLTRHSNAKGFISCIAFQTV